MVDQVDSLSKLTFLAEVMSAQELPGSLDLISALLDSLARILGSVATTRPELIYIEQLFMTCIDSVASQIKVRHFAFQKWHGITHTIRKCQISLPTRFN